MDIVTILKDLFGKYDSISIDYEGDSRYLTIAVLTEILSWMETQSNTRKKLFYTIAIRSKHDILVEERIAGQYVHDLLNLYETYTNFNVILVAGNKKYVDQTSQKLSLSLRFHTWVQELLKRDSTRIIYFGADNIFKLTKTLLETYDRTRAILLKNPALQRQMNFFSSELQHKLGIYSLAIESAEKAIQYDFVKGYLQRRGIDEIQYKEKIEEYAVSHTNFLNKNYNFMFLFSVNEFT